MAIIEGILGGASLLGSIYKGIEGAGQRREGERLWNDIKKRRAAGEFTYRTPNEIGESLNLAKNSFLDPRLPGQSTAESKIRSNTSQAVGLSRMSGRSPSDIIAGIVGSNANENMAFTDLADKAAMLQLQEQEKYGNELKTTAEYEDKAWEYNVYMPMMQDMQYAQSLIGSGNQNLYGAITDATSGLSGLAMASGDGKGLSELFNKWFKKRNTSGVEPVASQDPL